MINATINWYSNAKQILILEVKADEWDWNESFAIMKDFKEEAESVQHNIYTIIIFHDTPTTPNKDVFRNIKQMTNLRPQNDLLTVFVGTNTLFRAIFNTVNKIYLLKNIFDKFRYVATKEQAVALIQHEQESLLAKNN